MSIHRRIFLLMVTLCAFRLATAAGAQEPSKPVAPISAQHEGHETPPVGSQRPSPAEQTETEQTHMHHMNIPVVKPELPRLGEAEKRATGPVYRLEELEQMTLAHNPTLAQAAAAIKSAQGRRLQSGLYPNPTAGYEGTEIRGGAFGGGEQGFFIEQPFVTGGKLGLNRKMGDAEVTEAEAEAQAQRWRVLNSMRMAYYRLLAAQEMLAMKKGLQSISQDTLRIARELHNVGQADDTEVLEAEIEDQAAETAVLTEQNTLLERWAALATVVGDPRLERGIVQGDLEADFPQPDEHHLLDALLKESPQVKIAQAALARAQAALGRAKREPIPDIVVRAGLQQNNELLNPPSRSVGLQGFAIIGVQLHIFDRNQGNVTAARAEVEQARQEVERTELSLRARAAVVLQAYRSARVVAVKYHDEILPRAQKAYELMVKRYGLMTASYLQVLNLQRTLYRAETGYIDALEAAWTGSVALRGYLLAGGLESPGVTRGMELRAEPGYTFEGMSQPKVLPPMSSNAPWASDGLELPMGR